MKGRFKKKNFFKRNSATTTATIDKVLETAPLHFFAQVKLLVKL